MERKIIWTSRELKGREGLKYLDTSECLKLNDLVTLEQPCIIENIDIGVLLHTIPNSPDDDDEEYNTMIITDGEGNSYSTSSENFIRKFREIVEYLEDNGDEDPYSIKVFKRVGNNNNPFITCNII